MHILLVEDDPMLAKAIGAGLRQNGWTCDHAPDAPAAAIALVDHGYDAVLLDLALPGGSGLELLRAQRARYDATPVIIVTARDALSEQIAGLDAGADDYVAKPFQFDELYARLRAVSRRSNGRVAPILRCGAIELDPAQRRVTSDGAVVSLSIHEYRTLLALMERQGRLVTREQIEDIVYGAAVEIESNTIAVYVHQLRRKLGDDMIATVRGYGYCLGEPRA